MHRLKALRANPGRATQPPENNAHSTHRVPGTIGKRTSLNKVKLTMLQHPARRLGIFFLLWLIYPLPLSATQSDDATLKFITIDVAPWAAQDPQSQKKDGAFFDIVHELQQRTGYQIQTSVTPFARVDRELESGYQDCTMLVPRPDTLVVTGELVFNHSLGAIARKDLPLNTYEDLRELRISVLRGGSLNERFDTDDTLTKELDTDYIIGLRKMARGRTDAIVGAISTLQHMAEQEGISDVLGEPLVMEEMALYLQCSKKSRHLEAMPALNEALIEMRRDGTLDAIKQQHGL